MSNATTNTKPAVGAIAPWYGSNRIGAHRVGALLQGCGWVGIPFGGGLCEVAHIDARTVAVNDLHRHVINLAEVVAQKSLRHDLVRNLSRLAFHPDTLAAAQTRCRERWDRLDLATLPWIDRLAWAQDYFVSAWMARNGVAGTPGEFSGGLSMRWDAAGGDSATRFRNAADSLEAWGVVMQRCTFTVGDAFDFLGRVKDAAGIGIYCDPPFPGPGDRYTYPLGLDAQHELAQRLSEFAAARVVCRFYDVPLIRELYTPAMGWTWLEGIGRKQSNATAPEVLLVKNGGAA